MTIWPSRAMVWMILIPMEMSLPGISWVYAWDVARHMHLHMPREHFLGIDLRRGCERRGFRREIQSVTSVPGRDCALWTELREAGGPGLDFETWESRALRSRERRHR